MILYFQARGGPFTPHARKDFCTHNGTDGESFLTLWRRNKKRIFWEVWRGTGGSHGYTALGGHWLWKAFAESTVCSVEKHRKRRTQHRKCVLTHLWVSRRYSVAACKCSVSTLWIFRFTRWNASKTLYRTCRIIQFLTKLFQLFSPFLSSVSSPEHCHELFSGHSKHSNAFSRR